MQESVLRGLRNRLFQSLAMSAPGGASVRVFLHRCRGVEIGEGVWIGSYALLETAYPSLIRIGSRVVIGIRSTIIAHFQEQQGVEIMDDVYIGTGALILPGVKIGQGAVVSAGSVVSSPVPPMTLVQGNPARNVARCGIPLGLSTSRREFIRNLRPIKIADR
jgi:acetyltransferase-like isoleucine patch superfamily enzyme